MIRPGRGVSRGVGRRDRESICAGLALCSHTRFHYHHVSFTAGFICFGRVFSLFEGSSQDEYETEFVQHRNVFNIMGVPHRDVYLCWSMAGGGERLRCSTTVNTNGQSRKDKGHDSTNGKQGFYGVHFNDVPP